MVCCVALHLSSLQRTYKVRLIPRDLRALPLEYFTKLLKLAEKQTCQELF